MGKGEEALQEVEILMKHRAPDVDLRFDESPGGGFRCTMRSETAVHRFDFGGAELKAFQATQAGRNKIQRRLADELDCLRMKEKIKEAAAPLYPGEELVFGHSDTDRQVRVDVRPQGTVPSYSAMGPDELTALKDLLIRIKRAARMCSR